MRRHELDNWTNAAVRRYLEKLVDALDAVDEDDGMSRDGLNGWRCDLMGEDCHVLG